MMGGYVLSCESTVDLSREHLARRNISYTSYPRQPTGPGTVALFFRGSPREN